MIPEARAQRKLELALAQEKRERLAFWESLPLSERTRLYVWFAQQFGVDVKVGVKSEVPTPPVSPKTKAMLTEGPPPQQLIVKPDVLSKLPPLNPRVSKEKPPWWKR